MRGLRLKELRENIGLSQKELADRLDIKVRTYGSWEREEKRMSLDQAFELSRVLGCKIDDLIVKDEPDELELTPDEKSLIDTYRGLDKQDRGVTVRVMSALVQTKENTN